MDVSDVVAVHLPIAVITSLLIVAFDIYTGEISAPAHPSVDLVVYVVALLVGFVVTEAVWNQIFIEVGI